ncbi:MAG: hypothetical protein Q7S96_02160 [bacterium]|nr:hypothetical protein [bacterium]
MTDSIVFRIEYPRVRKRDALHERSEHRILQRFEQEVDMIRHEDEVVDTNGIAFLITMQQLKILFVISLSMKDRTPTIPPIDDVVENARILDA